MMLSLGSSVFVEQWGFALRKLSVKAVQVLVRLSISTKENYRSPSEGICCHHPQLRFLLRSRNDGRVLKAQLNEILKLLKRCVVNSNVT